MDILKTTLIAILASLASGAAFASSCPPGQLHVQGYSHNGSVVAGYCRLAPKAPISNDAVSPFTGPGTVSSQVIENMAKKANHIGEHRVRPPVAPHTAYHKPASVRRFAPPPADPSQPSVHLTFTAPGWHYENGKRVWNVIQ